MMPKGRRVLIVTSAYAPAMTADMHRARHLAWELPSLGWSVEILCPDASYQAAHSMDGDSEGFFAPGIVVHEAPQRFSWIARALRLGGIGWRAFLPMLFAGLRLLKQSRYDLVFFSTTQVPLFMLGPMWSTFRGVPFVLDIQDPLYKEGSATPVWSRPSVKHTIAHRLARAAESISVPRAAGMVAVSPAYIETLRERYGRKNPAWIAAARNAVIPFPFSLRDLQEAAPDPGSSSNEAGTRTIAYVGAGGSIMARAFGLLCTVLARLREKEPELLQGMRIELRGTMTGWKQGDHRHLFEIAMEHGVGGLVDEDPLRVSFRRSVELLMNSDGALVLGIDNAGYMPSKLFTYAGSRKPILAVVHRESPAYMEFSKHPELGHAIGFDDTGQQDIDEAIAQAESFAKEVRGRLLFDRESALSENNAANMSRRHVELFEACL